MIVLCNALLCGCAKGQSASGGCRGFGGVPGRMQCAPTSLRHNGAAECCRGSGCSRDALLYPPRMGVRGLTQFNGKTVLRNAAGSLRVSLSHSLFRPPRMGDQEGLNTGIEGFPRPRRSVALRGATWIPAFAGMTNGGDWGINEVDRECAGFLASALIT